jgi:uncharacterized membrane protein YeaQ/YmgE (transglycosylase-associated protein family)
MEYFKYMWHCLAVGVVAGALAGQVLRGKHTFLVDLIVGVIGALLGGYLFGKLEMAAKAGWVGAAVFAAIGAVVFLVGWRTIGSVDT